LAGLIKFVKRLCCEQGWPKPLTQSTDAIAQPYPDARASSISFIEEKREREEQNVCGIIFLLFAAEWCPIIYKGALHGRALILLSQDSMSVSAMQASMALMLSESGHFSPI
jgi:hypothetical protein